MSNRSLLIGDYTCDGLLVNNTATIPRYSSNPAIALEGSLYYNISDELIYKSNGINWIPLIGNSGGSNYERDITVAKSGGDFTNLVDAIAFAITLNPTLANNVQIRIFPGTYNEINPINLPDNIQITSYAEVAVGQVIITPVNNGLDIINSGNNVGIDGLYFIGGARSIVNNGNVVRVSHCTFSEMSTAVYSVGAGTTIISESTLIINSQNTVADGFVADSGTILWGSNLIVRNLVNLPASGVIAYKVDSNSADTFMFLNDCSSIRVGKSIEANATIPNKTNISVQSGRSLNCLIGADIGINSTVFLTGHDVVSIIPNTISIRLNHTTSVLKGVGSRFNSDTILSVPGSIIECSFYSDSSDDPAQEIRGELHVGSIDFPTKSAFGEGDSYINGMRIFHCTVTSTTDDGSSFTEITDKLRFNDSLLSAIFPNTNTNACMLIGSEKADYIGGIKVWITSGIVPSGGIDNLTRLIRPEYWNGTSWSRMRIMSTEADAGYYPHADNLFDVGEFQYRAGPSVEMVLKTINGVTAFWSRYRLVGNITTNPVANKIKLHTSRLEVNKDGFTEFFGKAEKREKYPYNINLAASAGSSPNNANLYVSKTIRVGRTENRFSIGDEIGFMIELPDTIDTSKNLKLEVRYFLDEPSLSSGGDVRIRIRSAYLRDFDDDPGALSTIADNDGDVPGIPPGLLSNSTITVSVPTNGGNKLRSFIHNIDISPLISRRNTGSNMGDTLAVHIERISGISGLLLDPFVIVQVIPVYIKWCDGTFL